jgi:DNA polymerase III alpha subunit
LRKRLQMETYMSNDYDDAKTWQLFAEGKTKGVFQLESNLGKSWSKKLSPNNIEELSALIAIIRPGCLKAYVDGKSMTQHFIDRKHGREEVTYLHESLEEILAPTYGVLVYQEQSMRIAQKIAGFDLQEADELRKAIGKKKADLMAKVKKNFIAGAKKTKIVNKEEAEEIFGWIQASSRYAFNKSHSISYAVCSYWSAYQKAHNPQEFFLSYLYYANEKQDPHQEIYELISEAKLFDIEARTPSLANFDVKFNVKKGKIYFGIKDIKSLTGKTGDKVVEGVQSAEKDLSKPMTKFTWLEILLFFAPKISSTAFKALASVGFFRDFLGRISRNRAIYEYEIYRTLTKAEQTWVQKNYELKKWDNFTDCLKDLAPTKKNGGGTSKVDRQQAVENEIQLLVDPPYDLEDDPNWIVDQEARCLGCPISLNKIDTSDKSAANTTCKEIVNGKKGKSMCVAANLQRLSDYTITKGESKGKTMAFLTIEDETCILDSVIAFPSVRQKYKYILYEGNNLIFCGSISGKDNAFILDKIYEI